MPYHEAVELIARAVFIGLAAGSVLTACLLLVLDGRSPERSTSLRASDLPTQRPAGQRPADAA